MRKPWMRGSKASIATWDLTVAFQTKEQLTGVVHRILAESIDFPFEVSLEPGELWVLTIPGMSWADNLQTIAGIIQDWDHGDPGGGSE